MGTGKRQADRQTDGRTGVTRNAALGVRAA